MLRPLEEIGFRPPTEPFRICINDLNMGTVRMRPDGELALLHWDIAGPNVPEWELAYVVKHWASGRRANPGTARAIVEGYAEEGDPPDLDASSFWLSITADLNSAHDQFCRALGDPGEKQDFSRAAAQDVITDGFSPPKLQRLLAEL